MKIGKMLELDSGDLGLWGAPGYRNSGAGEFQQPWVITLHFIRLIKVPEGAARSVKQGKMHINSLR